MKMVKWFEKPYSMRSMEKPQFQTIYIFLCCLQYQLLYLRRICYDRNSLSIHDTFFFVLCLSFASTIMDCISIEIFLFFFLYLTVLLSPLEPANVLHNRCVRSIFFPFQFVCLKICFLFVMVEIVHHAHMQSLVLISCK